ncbi:MAG: thiamine phosphate synthase [Butyrivibrio sp.]|jgi:thiamine-phosphate pyrophosphorylase|nr:thiamine phosphate synthase [Butyrivibrio sp.]
MYKKICITNRHQVNSDFMRQMEKIASSDVDAIVLREDDVSENEFYELAWRVQKICQRHGLQFIVYSFPEVARKLNADGIHLPIREFRKINAEFLGQFKVIGVSAHSCAEAVEAQELGASYITFGHIFAKERMTVDLKPQRTGLIMEARKLVSVPIFAAGENRPERIMSSIDSNVNGICMMTEYAEAM